MQVAAITGAKATLERPIRACLTERSEECFEIVSAVLIGKQRGKGVGGDAVVAAHAAAVVHGDVNALNAEPFEVLPHPRLAARP